MRITWLQDYDIFAFPGGAEMNDAAHFAAGLRRSHDIKLLMPQMAFYKPELLIVSNCINFDRKRLADMVNAVPTVFFFHDYIFCKYRLFYPAADKCQSCKFAKYWKDLYLKAKLLIWLSPLHREVTLKAMPELESSKYALVPSAINPDLFLFAESSKRFEASTYLTVNTLAPYKGRDNIIKFANAHPEIQIHAIAAEILDKVPGNITLIPVAGYNQMPALYSQYKTYLELPTTPQPFNRTVIEARLSGCSVITNELLGAASYGWFKCDGPVIADQLRSAPDLFWKNIEEAI